jgi:nicotinamidase-related amidase
MIAIDAERYAFEFDPARTELLIIDMQRDFLEPGVFGEMLGNDVSQLRRTIEPNRRLLATGFALAGTIFTFFGFIHGEAIGWGSSPTVEVGYLGVAAILFFLSRFAEFHPVSVELHGIQEAEAD